jgi:hypothetical protein
MSFAVKLQVNAICLSTATVKTNSALMTSTNIAQSSVGMEKLSATKASASQGTINANKYGATKRFPLNLATRSSTQEGKCSKTVGSIARETLSSAPKPMRSAELCTVTRSVENTFQRSTSKIFGEGHA